MNYDVAQINGGTFDGTQAEATIYNTKLDNLHDKGKLSITAGTFKAPENGVVIKVNKLSGWMLGDITITGGLFEGTISADYSIDYTEE